jgi:triphosphatase
MHLQPLVSLIVPAAALRPLRAHPLLKAEWAAPVRRVSTFFDTPERELRARQIELVRHREGWDWRLQVNLLPGCFEQQSWQQPVGPGGFDFAAIDRPPLRKLLNQLQERLQPHFLVDATVERAVVEFVGGWVQVELERVRLSVEGARHSALRLHLTTLEGAPAAALHLARALAGELKLRIQVEADGTWCLASLEGRVLKPFKARPELPARCDTRSAFLSIMHDCVQHLQYNEAGLLDDDHPEFVHQARVAIRRLRSALKLFAPCLPEAFVLEFSERWRELANALGDCRNLDVFQAEILPPLLADCDDSPLLRRLVAAAVRRGNEARKTARLLVADPSYVLLCLDFQAALQELEFPAALPSLRRFAGRRLEKRARQVTRLGQTVRDLDINARHQLRIAFKKLRYGLEFFIPLFGSRRSAEYLAGLSGLQEVLGRLNDLATADALIRELLPEGRAGVPLAWCAGRAHALIEALPAAVDRFLAEVPPWR